LEDLVYPSEISGKRVRVKTDGSRLIKVHLQDKFNSDKTETLGKVYKKLTGKEVSFVFPEDR
jgi:small subunit ribosomal protein S7e